jgi:hypothetical protein
MVSVPISGRSGSCATTRVAVPSNSWPTTMPDRDRSIPAAEDDRQRRLGQGILFGHGVSAAVEDRELPAAGDHQQVVVVVFEPRPARALDVEFDRSSRCRPR